MPGKRRPMSKKEGEMWGHVIEAGTHHQTALNYAFVKTTIGTLLFFSKRFHGFVDRKIDFHMRKRDEGNREAIIISKELGITLKKKK